MEFIEKLWLFITDLFANLDNALTDFGGSAVRVAFMVLGLAVYLIPTFIALKTQSPNKKLAIIINVLLGWTVVGWVVALVFAINKKRIGK
jgi:predicted membrane channel-forming protein YqfA (hemolysin III family)